MPTICQAYTFGTGVVADDGAGDGCTDEVVLNSETDPTCDLKCKCVVRGVWYTGCNVIFSH